jgi:hypothetical protein
MKLHEVKKGSKVLVKKIKTDLYYRYTTKEDKTYFAEHVSVFEVPFGQLKEIHVASKPEDRKSYIFNPGKMVQSNEYMRVVDYDNEWEMLVKPEDINFYCNISNEA